jgi:hypothetical protein
LWNCAILAELLHHEFGVWAGLSHKKVLKIQYN